MTYFKRVFILLAAVAGLSLPAFSLQADTAEIGPRVGTVIGIDFAAPDQNGDMKNFDNLVGEKGAVVVFYRSAKWCPFCQMQLIDLNTNAREAVEERGYSMIGISYDETKDIQRFHRKWRVGFPLLSDKGSKMIDALGLRNDAYEEGHYAHGVPHPVIFILDRDKRIAAKLMREGYRERPEPEVLIETLDQISASGR